MRIRTLSVTEVTQYLKRMISNDPILSYVSIQGEISNMKHHSSGHVYFTLKDDLARIQCVMFHGDAISLEFKPEDGQQVIVKGQVSIYEKEGRYQIYVRKMERAGLGDLYLKFEALKSKLEVLGYFRAEKKKLIPRYPYKIGVVTSGDGAAWRDIKAVLTRRSKNIEVFLCPAAVQGKGAAPEMIRAIQTLDDMQMDLIILARGGGSIEELWAFNEETLALAIHEAKTPIITGVGHETDFTISDFVADLRAPTPSAAAELAAVEHETLISELAQLMQTITVSSGRYTQKAVRELDQYAPQYMVNTLLRFVQDKQYAVDRCKVQVENEMQRAIESSRGQLKVVAQKLNGLSPLALLEKGYGIIQNTEGKRIKNCTETKAGDKIVVRIQDGSLKCQIESTERSSLDEKEKNRITSV